MPGIVGIVSQDSNDHASLLREMLESINHFDYKIDSTSKGNVFLGNVNLGYISNGISYSADKRFLISFTGEIFSYKTIETNQIDNDSEFFLTQFINDGFDCLKSINGQYCAAVYDFLEKKLYLISDRMGTRPIYYAEVDNNLFFAPEVKAILKSRVKKEIDYHSVSELFSFGHLFGHKTLFEGIKQLPEASYLVYSKEGYTIHKYWEIPEYPDAYTHDWPNSKRIQQYNDELIEVITNAMKRSFAKNSIY